MRTLTVLAALFAAAPINAQQMAWWTPVNISPELPKVVWWIPPCDCGNCGNDPAQKAAYAKAYDQAIKEGKALVLFVGQPIRRIDDAISVRYDGAELPAGTKSPAVVIGRGCNGLTLNQTALLPGEATERQIKDALRQQPVCPTCPKQQPFRIGASELNGVAGLLAAAMIGVVEGVDDAKTTQSPSVVSASFASPFVGSSFGSGDAVYFEARRRFAPVRRLFSLPFRAIRLARANRVEFVPAEQSVNTTAIRYEMTPVATYSLQPVTVNSPVTRLQWVEVSPAAMPAKK